MLDQLTTKHKIGALFVLVIILYMVYSSKKSENELVVEEVVIDDSPAIAPTPQQTIVMNVEPKKEIYVTDIKLSGEDVQFAEAELYNNAAVNIIKNILPTTSGPTWSRGPAINMTDGNTKNVAHRTPGTYGNNWVYWFNIKLKSPTKLKDITKVKIYSRPGVGNKIRGNNSKIQLLSNGEVVLQNEWIYVPNPETPIQTIREYAVKH